MVGKIRYNTSSIPGCGAVDSALGLGPRGRRFESFHPDHRKTTVFRWSFFYGLALDSILRLFAKGKNSRRFGAMSETQQISVAILLCKRMKKALAAVLSPRPYINSRSQHHSPLYQKLLYLVTWN